MATPPVAPKISHLVEIHGDRLTDDYFWLRNRNDPAVLSYLHAENDYTDAWMSPTQELQRTLYAEMRSRVRETDLSVPYRRGSYLYYRRMEKGRQYPIHCRRGLEPDAPEQVLLDLNQLARSHAAFDLGSFEVTDDGARLAYSTDTTGERRYCLRILDLTRGELVADPIDHVRTFAWAAGDSTLFYVTEDSSKRAYRLYRTQPGSRRPATLLYEEQDPLYSLGVWRSRSRACILVSSRSSTTSEYRFLWSDEPEAEPVLFLPRREGHEYDLDHHPHFFLIRTNDGAKNFRLMSAPLDVFGRSSWTELVPHRPEVTLGHVEVFSRHCVLLERSQGLEQIRVLDLESREERLVEFPDPAYSISPEPNEELATERFRFRYESFVTPPSVFDLDLSTGTSTLLKRDEIPGGWDAERYILERISVRARDGTDVPLSLVYRRDVRRDGSAPLVLYGYGAYGASISVSFSAARFSLVDRGVVWATAHVRGGGEMGEAWHVAGKLANKQNTFTDFIDVADHLVEQRLTRRDRLVIMGGSAGGLLIGAVLNLQPGLCRAAIAQVPFVDVLQTMLDASLPLTVGEYLEWGNPAVQADYERIRSYCPYTNLQPAPYPDILVRTSLNDTQVGFWEAAKYVAKLRSVQTGEGIILLETNLEAGHGGASGRYDRLLETAFDFAYILTRVGLEGTDGDGR